MDFSTLKMVIDEVSFNVSEWDLSEVKERFKEFMPEDGRFRLYEINEGNFQWKCQIKNRCDYLWRGMVILWDGAIVPCCLDPRGEMKMGEVKDGIRHGWNSPRYISLRKQILRVEQKLTLCSHCPGT